MGDNPKVLELRSRIDAIETELRTIHETAGDDPFTAEQQTQWDTLTAERAERAKEQADLEARLEQVARFAAKPENRETGDGATGAPKSPEFMRQVTPFDGTDPRALTRMEARDRALKVIEGKENTRHLRDDQREKADRVLRTSNQDCDGSFVGRLMLLTENDDYRSAFVKLVTQPNAVLTADEARAVNAYTEFRAMSGSTDASGGYGVPVLIDPAIILTAQGSLNPFRRLARVETVTTDAWRGVSSAGVSWSYGAEASRASDNSPTLDQPVVNVHEAKGFIPFSIRVGQDYPGFADEMSTLLVSGYDEKQAQVFATGAGDGSNEPFGILTALDANTNVEVSVTTDGAFGGADINKVWGALPDRWKANATWVMNYDVANEVASFGNGNNLSFVTVDLTGQIETLRTRPVEFSSYFPDFTGTTGAANVLVVGDWRNYLIADRVGMSIELIPHLVQQQTAGSGIAMPTGQRGWFAYARNGADSINDLGFRLLQNT